MFIIHTRLEQQSKHDVNVTVDNYVRIKMQVFLHIPSCNVEVSDQNKLKCMYS